LVEKNFGDHLRARFSDSEMTFKKVDGSLTAEFDSELLQLHLPPTNGIANSDMILARSLGTVIPETTRIALESTEFVGVYGRVVHGGPKGRTCLQYLYIYDYQAVPAHEADYEPVFVYLEKNRRTAIYDLIHYCTRSLQLNAPDVNGPGLNMVPGWHSFIPTQNLNNELLDRNLSVQPLSDQHLDTWWKIPDEEARLKIDDFIRDPFQIEAPGHFLKNPDENAAHFLNSKKLWRNLKIHDKPSLRG